MSASTMGAFASTMLQLTFADLVSPLRNRVFSHEAGGQPHNNITRSNIAGYMYRYNVR